MRRIRSQSESEYHALNGIIVQLSVMPEIDGKAKILMDFGSGNSAHVYVGSNWWIVYRLENAGSSQELVVISIWDADNPPHTRL